MLQRETNQEIHGGKQQHCLCFCFYRCQKTRRQDETLTLSFPLSWPLGADERSGPLIVATREKSEIHVRNTKKSNKTEEYHIGLIGLSLFCLCLVFVVSVLSSKCARNGGERFGNVELCIRGPLTPFCTNTSGLSSCLCLYLPRFKLSCLCLDSWTKKGGLVLSWVVLSVVLPCPVLACPALSSRHLGLLVSWSWSWLGVGLLVSFLVLALRLCDHHRWQRRTNRLVCHVSWLSCIAIVLSCDYLVVGLYRYHQGSEPTLH